ncbi:MAG: hypothetical protein OXC61_02730 [Flavobacteriaceae bacterium]|nr:hypothetical protein [Flavobacteriaceae bacterium]
MKSRDLRNQREGVIQTQKKKIISLLKKKILSRDILESITNEFDNDKKSEKHMV